MGHMSRRVRGQALGLVAAGFLFTAALGGCTSGETPTSPPSAPSSTAVAPTTTVIPTTSAMTDEEAAIAAARNYYEEFNRALVTLDTHEFRAVVQPGCLVCEEDASKIESLRASGRKIVGGHTSLANPQIESRTSPSEVVVVANLGVAAMQVLDASGKIVASSTAKDVQMRLWLRKEGARWLVQAVFS